MINLYEKFCTLNRTIKNAQTIIKSTGIIKAYYGISKEGFFRVSFLSSKEIGIKELTKNINIIQGYSSDNNYWTCFDLHDDNLLQVFCTFGEDLISCIFEEQDEKHAVTQLKNRYRTWVALFKKNRNTLSQEKLKGLFGELYFLKNFMIGKYGVEDSVKAWSGPELYNKDFSINETWYEIKTINPISAVVKISSIQQLSSEYEGNLVIIKAENMSEAYKGKDSSINEIVQYIISNIKQNDLKDLFLDKLLNAGFDFSDEGGNIKYQVMNLEFYIVNKEFPTLRETDIKNKAINNVSYELVIKLIEDFLEKKS